MCAAPALALLAIVLAATLAPSAHAAKSTDRVVGTKGDGNGEFDGPRAVAVNATGAGGVAAGTVYVADTVNRRIVVFDPDGSFNRAWGWDVVSSGPNDTVAGEFEVCVDADGDVCKAGVSGGGAGQLSDMKGVAIDPSTGDVLVAEPSRVQRFDAVGNFERMWGRNVIEASPTGGSTDLGDVAEICTVAEDCQASSPGGLGGELNILGTVGQGVAVDAAGDVYVAERTTVGGNGRISKFDADGNFIVAWGWGVVSSGGVGDAGSDAFERCMVAADCRATTDKGDNLGQFGFGAPTDIAVDSTGRVYVLDLGSGRPTRVQRFQPDGSSPEDFAASVLSTAPTLRRLAVDPVADRVFVSAAGGSPQELRFWELDTDGNLIEDEHGKGVGVAPHVPNGLAIDPPTGTLYFTTANVDTGHRLVAMDDDGGFEPGSASIRPPTDIGGTTATFHGTVNPNGFDSSYRFEHSKNGVDWMVSGPEVDIGDGTTDMDVDFAASGLEANTVYRVRLVLTTLFGGQDVTEEIMFVTDAIPPTVTTRPAIQVSDTGAVLMGRVNPNNLAATYHFEYGTTQSYGIQVPLPAATAGSGGVAQTVSERLSGLLSGVTYHYRIVATNGEGTTFGTDRTFETRQPVEAPPGRAYEMVTPPDKNNRITGFQRDGDGVPVGYPGVPSPDGESLVYSVVDGILDPGAGTAFPHDRDVVVIRRNAAGWSGAAVHDIEAATGAAVPATSAIAMSADHSVSAWRHDAWLFPSGSRLGTKVFGSTSGVDGSGWHDWLGGTPFADPGHDANRNDRALIDDVGTHMVRWGCYAGLLGPSDPSNGQFDDVLDDGVDCESGRAIYHQSPPGSGARQLVNACTGTGTGTGADATLIPVRDSEGTSVFDGGFPALDDDTVAAQPCEDGSPTSRRGAAIGPARELGSTQATAISEDGRRLFFASPDPNAAGVPEECADVSLSPPAEFVGADTDCPPQLFVRELDGSGAPTVRWISSSRSTPTGDNGYGTPMIADQPIEMMGRGVAFDGASADGSVVYFRTNAPLTPDDPNGGSSTAASDVSWDLYRYEVPSAPGADPGDGTLTRISGGPSGTADPNTNCTTSTNPVCGSDSQPTGEGAAARYVSDDGLRVYFATNAPIPGAANDAAAGAVEGPVDSPTANSGFRNLYLYDDTKSGSDRWQFVARIPFVLRSLINQSGVDACAGFFTSTGATRDFDVATYSLGRERNTCVRGSASGETLAFESAGRLTADDDDDAADVYVYDAARHELIRVSAPPAGQEPYPCSVEEVCNADLGFRNASGYGDNVGRKGARHWNVSDDGEVFFETRLALVPEDTNGSHYDTYMWRAGDLSLISSGNTDDHAFYSGNSEDGDDVFFWTSQRIDPREIEDADFDVYDARVGGGFPPPPPPPGPGCAVLVDACQPAGAGRLPVDEGTSQPGGGNANPGARVRLAVRVPGRQARRRAARTGVLPIRVRTTRAGRVVAVAKARVRVVRRRGGRRLSVRTVARRHLVLRRAGTAVLRLKLSRVAMRRLRAGRPVRLRIVVRQRGARPRAATVVLRRARR
ncbi:MAG: hypothetical protein WD993_08635 [Thermoleophilaceae bacterium]